MFLILRAKFKSAYSRRLIHPIESKGTLPLKIPKHVRNIKLHRFLTMGILNRTDLCDHLISSSFMTNNFPVYFLQEP